MKTPIKVEIIVNLKSALTGNIVGTDKKEIFLQDYQGLKEALKDIYKAITEMNFGDEWRDKYG